MLKCGMGRPGNGTGSVHTPALRQRVHKPTTARSLGSYMFMPNDDHSKYVPETGEQNITFAHIKNIKKFRIPEEENSRIPMVHQSDTSHEESVLVSQAHGSKCTGTIAHTRSDTEVNCFRKSLHHRLLPPNALVSNVRFTSTCKNHWMKAIDVGTVAHCLAR